MTIFGVVYVPKNKIEYFKGTKPAPLTDLITKSIELMNIDNMLMFCKEDKQMSFFCDDEEFDYDDCKSGDTAVFVGMADIRRLGYHNVLKNFAKLGVRIHIIPYFN